MNSTPANNFVAVTGFTSIKRLIKIEVHESTEYRLSKMNIS